jgi:hypothetical protein
MKIRCLFGHNWREVPKFKPRDSKHWSNPTKVCLRCFKQSRKRYDIIVESAAGPGWRYYLPPHWEGQSVPKGYSSWEEYRERTNQAVRNMIGTNNERN